MTCTGYKTTDGGTRICDKTCGTLGPCMCVCHDAPHPRVEILQPNTDALTLEVWRAPRSQSIELRLQDATDQVQVTLNPSQVENLVRALRRRS